MWETSPPRAGVSRTSALSLISCAVEEKKGQKRGFVCFGFFFLLTVRCFDQ